MLMISDTDTVSRLRGPGVGVVKATVITTHTQIFVIAADPCGDETKKESHLVLSGTAGCVGHVTPMCSITPSVAVSPAQHQRVESLNLIS